MADPSSQVPARRNSGYIKYLSWAGFFILVATALLCLHSTRNYLESARWRQHSDQVISSLRGLRIHLETSESAQRGYILTADPDLLDHYTRYHDKIAPEISELSTLMADNPEQLNRLKDLHPLIQERMEFLNKTLDMARAQRQRDAIETIKSGHGMNLMDRVRSAIMTIEGEEQKLLATRAMAAETDFRFSIWTVVVGLLVAFALLFMNSYLLQSENRARMESESELHRAKVHAQEASKSKSSFLANMSHEIRTPLNGIIGMTKMLEQTELNDRQRDYVDTVKTSSNSLLALINQILDLSKIEAGKLQLEDTHFELNSLIKSTVSIIDYGAKAKGLKVNVDVADDVPEFYLGDALRLRQVLLNLLNNAVKFSERGTITLKVRKLSNEESRARLRFEVIDQGVGFDPGARGRLFQTFSQGDESTSRRYGGTGLGLSISKQIVEMMEGEIDVESVVGVGSRFYFDVYLKVAKYDDIARPVSVDKMALKSLNGYVLIAEDNLVNQKVISEMMALLGCRIRIVENGSDALNALKQEDFNLVLMDGQMPMMDGYEATRYIRHGEAGSKNVRIPIVATTANAIQGDIEKCLEAGMNDYIGKPISYDDLAFKVEKWMTRGRNVLDAAAIERLKLLASKGNKTLIADLIGIFQSDTPHLFEKMRGAVAVQDYSQLAQLAHNLKSSCANLGALRMRELSERIERTRTGANEQHVGMLVDALEREFALVLEELEELKKI